jgi:hypothetical protein
LARLEQEVEDRDWGSWQLSDGRHEGSLTEALLASDLKFVQKEWTRSGDSPGDERRWDRSDDAIVE